MAITFKNHNKYKVFVQKIAQILKKSLRLTHVNCSTRSVKRMTFHTVYHSPNGPCPLPFNFSIIAYKFFSSLFSLALQPNFLQSLSLIGLCKTKSMNTKTPWRLSMMSRAMMTPLFESTLKDTISMIQQIRAIATTMIQALNLQGKFV